MVLLVFDWSFWKHRALLGFNKLNTTIYSTVKLFHPLTTLRCNRHKMNNESNITWCC